MIATASGCCLAEPSPMASARGNNVRMAARVVIVIGRRRLRLASQWVASERTWPITLLSAVRRFRTFAPLRQDGEVRPERCLWAIPLARRRAEEYYLPPTVDGWFDNRILDVEGDAAL